MPLSSGWEEVIGLYQNSPLATMILSDKLEKIWQNQAMYDISYLAGSLDIIRYFEDENKVLQQLKKGHPVSQTTENLLDKPLTIILHPYIKAEKFIGAVVHVTRDGAPDDKETASESVYQPVSVFSNQFRTPLSRIFSSLQLLKDEYKDDDNLLKRISNINQMCYQILHTVVNFSEDSKLLARQIHPQKKAGDICRFVRELCQDAVPLITKTGRKFDFDVPTDPVFTTFDENMLSYALLNLLSNACKFTKNDGSIALRLEKNDAQVNITVRDNGAGMSPATLDRAFSRFFSYDPQTGGPSGDGLGLYITRCVVELHAGSLALYSVEHEGTTAAFTIPVVVDELQTEFMDVTPRYGADRFSNLYVFLSDICSPD